MPADDTVPFNMRMDKGLKERLDAYCKESGRSRTYVVTMCLGRFLDAAERQAMRNRETRPVGGSW